LRRLEDVRIPVESAEIYEIARLRLFQSISPEMAQQAAETYSQMYRSDPWKDQLPLESREAGYDGLLLRAFHFIPVSSRYFMNGGEAGLNFNSPAAPCVSFLICWPIYG